MITKWDVLREQLYRIGVALIGLAIIVWAGWSIIVRSPHWKFFLGILIAGILASLCMVDQYKRKMFSVWTDLGRPLSVFPITEEECSGFATRFWAQKKLRELAEAVGEAAEERNRLCEEYVRSNQAFRCYNQNTPYLERSYDQAEALRKESVNASERELAARRRFGEALELYQAAWHLLVTTSRDKRTPGIGLLPRIREEFSTPEAFLKEVTSIRKAFITA